MTLQAQNQDNIIGSFLSSTGAVIPIKESDLMSAEPGSFLSQFAADVAEVAKDRIQDGEVYRRKHRLRLSLEEQLARDTESIRQEFGGEA